MDTKNDILIYFRHYSVPLSIARSSPKASQNVCQFIIKFSPNLLSKIHINLIVNCQ